MLQEKGLYIAFEGGEGSGKSTQSNLLADKIGESAVSTREPGGTNLGAGLRELLLNPEKEPLSAMTEAFLAATDRAHHMDKVVRPALEERKHVIADRSFVSGIAYQGAGRGLGVEKIISLNLLNPELILPDLVLILGSPSKEFLSHRLKDQPDKLESAGDAFHSKVAVCYGQMAHILAADSRTAGISVVALEAESCGQPKSIEDIRREIVVVVEDYCHSSNIASPV